MNETEKRISDLYKSISQCNKCPLCKSRNNIVFGRGDPNAKLLFIGEAPGKNEDEQGKPFVGQAGQLLDNFLLYAGFNENDYYITNILKCRPPQNRDPDEYEEEMCIPYLKAQVQIIQPDIIVCLGRIAAKRIISPDFRITAERGKWFQAQGTQIMATFHPAALLRDPSKKILFLQDIKKLKNKFNEI